MAKWCSEGRLKQDRSLKDGGSVDALSGNTSQSRKLSINELDDRVAMLMDLRAQGSLIKRELGEILRSLSALQNSQLSIEPAVLQLCSQ